MCVQRGQGFFLVSFLFIEYHLKNRTGIICCGTVRMCKPFAPKSLIRKDKTCDSLAGCKVLKLSSLVEVYHLSVPHCPCQEISPASYSQPHLNRACLSSPRRLCFSSFPRRYYISVYSHGPIALAKCHVPPKRVFLIL